MSTNIGNANRRQRIGHCDGEALTWRWRRRWSRGRRGKNSRPIFYGAGHVSTVLLRWRITEHGHGQGVVASWSSLEGVEAKGGLIPRALSEDA